MKKKPAQQQPKQPKAPKPPPRSWIWVEKDDPAKRIHPHEVTLGVELQPGGGGVIDLFVERGGKEFLGLTVQAIRVPGLRTVEQLAGNEVIDPPPAVAGIGKLGAALPTCGGAGPSTPLRTGGLSKATGDLLKKLAAGPEGPESGTGSGSGAGAGADEDLDEEAEEASPDDDPELGDIETYRRRRIEEAKLAPPEEDVQLDDEALAEAEAEAAAERLLIAPGQAYEVESIRLKVRAIRGREAEIDIEGRCGRVGDDGEVEEHGLPFGGHVFANLEVL